LLITAIIPALDEEHSIGNVVSGLLGNGADDVVVVDNGSTDSTPDAARAAGARVVYEARRGYGSACLAGIAALEETDIVVFADGDGCDDPCDLPSLVSPIERGEADMVIGSRLTGRADVGALPIHSRVGNRIAGIMLRLIYGQRATDLGPFRAIRFASLLALEMSDTGFGWTAEMQAKAALAGLRVLEVPVHYRKRSAGKSKITGNIKASILAGWIIIKTLVLTRIRARHLIVARMSQTEEERVCESGH
jgi:glycosyltransferase involved in cell wall biosynthesis